MEMRDLRARPGKLPRVAAIVAALLAIVALAAGCGGDGEDETPVAGDRAPDAERPTTGGSGAAPDGGEPGKPERPKGGNGGPGPTARADFGACLRRNGVTEPSAPDGAEEAKPFGTGRDGGLEKLRSAVRECRGEVPKRSSPITERERKRARQAAAQRAERVREFRECMGRYGFGPEAQSDAQRGDAGDAFAECGDELSAAP